MKGIFRVLQVVSIFRQQYLQQMCMCCAGMRPKDTRRFRGNSYYKSAMHAAVEYPDLAMLMEGGSSMESGNSPKPGTKQVRHPLTGLGQARPPAPSMLAIDS